MSAVDASQLGLDLTKKPKKTKSSSTAAAADGEKKKKKSSTKKTVAVDEQELIQIEQSSVCVSRTWSMWIFFFFLPVDDSLTQFLNTHTKKYIHKKIYTTIHQ